MDEPRPRAESRLRRLTVRGVQLALTVLVTWLIVRQVGLGMEDLRGLDAALWRPDPLRLLGSCLMLLAGYVVSGLLWGWMVADLGGPRMPAGTAIRTFIIANLGRYIPGKLWQIAGLALLARRKGVSATVATGAAVLGQAFAVVAATLLGATALLQAGPELRRVGTVLLGAVAVGVTVSAVPAVFRRFVGLWFRLARRTVPEGIRAGPSFTARWVGLYVVNWGVYAISFWMLVESFDIGSELGLLQAGPAFAAAYVVGYVAVFAPAGAGVREGALIALLGSSVGVAHAAVLAVVARLWATVVEVVPAALFWLRHLSLERAAVAGEERGES